MITLVTGKIGSGKTLYTVGEIVKHVGRGGLVFSNIEIVHAELVKVVSKRFGVVPLPEQVRKINLVEDQAWHKQILWGTPDLPVLVVLDEIHLFFNARDWAKTQALHRDMLSFLSQSRKACVDVMFIAQVATTLEKQFRVQCEWEFYCRNLSDIQLPLVGRLPFRRLLLVQRDQESDKPVNRFLRKYDTELFPVYDTRAFLDGAMQQAAEVVDRFEGYKLERARPAAGSGRLLLGMAGAALVAFLLHRVTAPKSILPPQDIPAKGAWGESPTMANKGGESRNAESADRETRPQQPGAKVPALDANP